MYRTWYTGTCLRQLDLSDNPMTSEVAGALAEMLHSQVHLQILNLNDTSLEDEGVSTVAAALVNAGMMLPSASNMHPLAWLSVLPVALLVNSTRCPEHSTSVMPVWFALLQACLWKAPASMLDPGHITGEVRCTRMYLSTSGVIHDKRRFGVLNRTLLQGCSHQRASVVDELVHHFALTLKHAHSSNVVLQFLNLKSWSLH